MLRNIDLAVESAAKENSMYAGGQLDMFSVFGGEEFSSEPQFSRCDELPKNENLNFEKEVAGLYFSGHPLEEYKDVTNKLNCPKTIDLLEYLETKRENLIDNQKVNFIGIVTSSKKKFTKRDEIMAFCEVEDLYGSIEMIVFPKVFAAHSGLLFAGSIILVEGRISVKDDEIKLLAEKISVAPEKIEITTGTENQKQKKGLFIRVNKTDEAKIPHLKNLLSIFEGKIPVYLYFSDSKKYEFMGKEYLIDVNEPLIKELKLIFGDENIVLRV